MADTQHVGKIVKNILYAIIFVVGLSLVGFYLALRPFRIVSTITPEHFGVKYEKVEFLTSDHVLIKGWFIPAKKPQAKTIILLHGYPADKGNILPSRLFLHKNYNLLFIDFRYLGESGGFYSTVGVYETRDVKAALNYLHQRGIHEAALWGFSLGGAVALMTANDAPEIKAMVVESPYARLEWLANQHYPIPGINWVIGQLFRVWGLLVLQVDITHINPVDHAGAVKIPLLLMYSKSDRLITYQHALAMQAATKDNGDVRIIIYEGKNHGEPADNYQEIVEDFFAEKY